MPHYSIWKDLCLTQQGLLLWLLKNLLLNRNCYHNLYGLYNFDFLAPKPTSYFFLNWNTSLCIIASQCDMLTVMLSRCEHEVFIFELYSQSPPISETINGEQLLGTFIFLSKDQMWYWNLSQLTYLLCARYAPEAFWVACENFPIPDMFLSPSKSPMLIASILSPDWTTLLFLHTQSHISDDSFQRTSSFSSTRDLNSVGKVSVTTCNHWEWRASILLATLGQLNPSFHIPLLSLLTTKE